MKLALPVSSQLKVDIANATTIYIGEASPGVATSTAAWRIFKVDTTSGVSIGYAGKDAGFIYVWDDRATYTYG